MEYTWDERGLTLFLTGELDHHGLRTLSREAAGMIDKYLPGRLIFDMGGVKFMDSSGIALVLNAVRRMAELDGQVVLRRVPASAAKIFRMAGIGRFATMEEEGKAI